ncbi:MAG TPA: DUF4097 family beta strand repeat-containing protein [Cyclobacteriaceae bacterium]|nr:DUF4097 family beta strand repeat-containing protein [Cyclobacteriaceae bacterium]
MKKLTITALVLLIAGATSAQEYKIAKSTGRLEINDVNNVTIEGTTGNEIVFTSLDGSRDRDDRAKGLRAISANGLEDNTGIGLAVRENGTTYEVYQLKKMDGPRVKILVPKGVVISYKHSSPHGSDVKLKNIEGEVEISTVHNSIRLDNVTGPMNVRTAHGEVEVQMNDNVKGPIYLSSTHGLVDLALPAATKANISMSAGHGEIFVDPALKLEVPKNGEWVKYGSSKVEGKVNGGGIDVTLNTSHGNLYLRKK